VYIQTMCAYARFTCVMPKVVLVSKKFVSMENNMQAHISMTLRKVLRRNSDRGQDVRRTTWRTKSLGENVSTWFMIARTKLPLAASIVAYINWENSN